MPEPVLAPFRRRLIPARTLLGFLALASLVIQFDAEPFGDELIYLQAAQDLAGLLQGDSGRSGADIGKVFDRVRGNGWFLPGIPLILTPVELLFEGPAPAWAFRSWMLVLNLGLLLAVVEGIGRRLGSSAAGLFALSCAVSPYYMAHLSSLYGGSLAILSTLLLFLWVDSWRLADLTPSRAALAGAVAAIIVYLRAMYLPIVFILMTGFTLMAAHRANWQRLPMAVLALFIGTGVVLAPWSWWVSREFGPTLTTTTMTWSQVAALGERSHRTKLHVEGHHASAGQHVSISHAFHQAIADRAQDRGVTFMEQARSERRRALAAAPVPELIRDVGKNIVRYVDSPSGFLRRFDEARCQGRAGCLPRPVAQALQTQAGWGWAVCATALCLYMLMPFHFDGRSRWLPFFGKSLVFMILIHCFVALAHNRYYFQLFPVTGMVAAWATTHKRGSHNQPTPSTKLHDRLIALGQVGGAAFAILFVGLYCHTLFSVPAASDLRLP